MAGFDGARQELHEAGQKKDAATMGWLSIIPFIARNHWDAILAFEAARYMDGHSDLQGIVDFFTNAYDNVVGAVA